MRKPSSSSRVNGPSVSEPVCSTSSTIDKTAARSSSENTILAAGTFMVRSSSAFAADGIDVVVFGVREWRCSDVLRITALEAPHRQLVEQRVLVGAVRAVVAVVHDDEVDSPSAQELRVPLGGVPALAPDALGKELRVEVTALAHDLVHADLAVAGADDPVRLRGFELRRVDEMQQVGVGLAIQRAPRVPRVEHTAESDVEQQRADEERRHVAADHPRGAV